MMIANSFENVNNGICQQNNNKNFLQYQINNIPCTRFGKKQNSSEMNPTIIDYVLVGKNYQIIKGIEVGNHRQHLQINKSDHVLIKVFIDENFKIDEKFISK